MIYDPPTLKQKKLEPFIGHRNHDVAARDGVWFCESCKAFVSPPPPHFWMQYGRKQLAAELLQLLEKIPPHARTLQDRLRAIIEEK